MKIEKNKLIFGAIVGSVILLMVGYYVLVIEDGEETDRQLEQTGVPALEENQKEYESKLEAIDDIKEERISDAPSVYDTSLLDSTGLYNANQKEDERQRIVDSIYRLGRIEYSSANNVTTGQSTREYPIGTSKVMTESVSEQTSPTDFLPAHQAFFGSDPHVDLPQVKDDASSTNDFIIVEVNGEQTVRTEGRLELRLATDADIAGQLVPRNTLIFAFVSFKANRVMLNITNIEHRKVDLRAFDLLDGNEGIYIENSFRAEAGREVLDDVVQDINIAGVPQIGGIKQVFRRSNRNVKVTVRNHYQLILKPHRGIN